MDLSPRLIDLDKVHPGPSRLLFETRQPGTETGFGECMESTIHEQFMRFIVIQVCYALHALKTLLLHGIIYLHLSRPLLNVRTPIPTLWTIHSI